MNINDKRAINIDNKTQNMTGNHEYVQNNVEQSYEGIDIKSTTKDSVNEININSTYLQHKILNSTPLRYTNNINNHAIKNKNENSTPTSSSPRRRSYKSVFSDRYIPNRIGVDLQVAFSLYNDDIKPDSTILHNVDNEIEMQKEEKANRTFSTVLKAELFGDNVPLITADIMSNNYNGCYNNCNSRPNSSGNVISSPRYQGSNMRLGDMNIYTSLNGNDVENTVHNSLASNNSGSDFNNFIHDMNVDTAAFNTYSNFNSNIASNFYGYNESVISTPRKKNNLFTYQSPQKLKPISRNIQNEIYSLSPVRQESQKLLLSPQKKPRNIPKVPYRVLDAPELSDDFYLNLVDWGQQDILAVGLGDSVYLWDGATQSVDRLCNLPNKYKVTSLNWIGLGTHLAIGTSNGLVEIWDSTKIKCIRTMSGHNLRVSSLAWNEHILSSGSRDRTILNRDVRIESHYVNKFESHKQEVCGLKWNVEENKLASGGNDNNLFIWEGLNKEPLHQFNAHTAAIKALCWSPFQRGVLVTGGGTADKTIKTWNVLTGTLTNNIDTGSQVCNMVWSKNSNELVSSHGYSRNQIIIWKYPYMQQIAQLTGHTYRVLYLSLSPDGETIVTGAGDETLRFWNVFEKNKNNELPKSVLLDTFLQLR